MTSTAVVAALLQPAVSSAAEIELTLDIPRHKERPYIAVWIEDEDRDIVRHLAVWHEGGNPNKQKKKKKKKGDKYLRDLHVWWRAGGRDEDMPMDGVSGPTRPAGEHTLNFESNEDPLGDLDGGDYKLVVEASREDGDQELIRLPLPWPPTEALTGSVRGKRELRAVTLTLTP